MTEIKSLLEVVGEQNFRIIYGYIYRVRMEGSKKGIVDYGGELRVPIDEGKRVVFLEVIPVDDQEVTKCANNHCSSCHGQGKIYVRPAQDPRKIKVTEGTLPENLGSFGELKEFVCDCAQRKFLRTNTNVYKDPVSGWCRVKSYRIEDAPEKATDVPSEPQRAADLVQ